MGKQWKQWQTLFSGAPESVVDSDCSLEIKRYLLLGRKAMSNLKESERRSVVSDSLWPPWTILQTKILEWVAFPFSRGYSWSRDQILISCSAGRFFTTEPPGKPKCVKWSESRSVMSNSLWPHGLYSPWNSPGLNTGVGSLSLLQEIFPVQGSNPCLLHCRQILYQLSYKGAQEYWSG